jgi:hypothetical protein
MQPTKQELMDYLDESFTHSPYTATIHFDISIESFYKIVKS